MIKIAISGKARSGKNTLSFILRKILIKELKIKKNNIQTEAFADPVKEMANILFPGKEHRKNFWGPSENRSLSIPNMNINYRTPLIDIGKLGRSYDQDIWVNLLLSKFNNVQNKSVFIVNDLRFINEYDLLKKEDFFFIRIKRSNSLNINDISETEQDSIDDSKFDLIIENNSSKSNLKKKILQILPVIKTKFIV